MVCIFYTLGTIRGGFGTTPEYPELNALELHCACWLLVSEPAFFKVLADFGRISKFNVGISVRKQYSLLDAIFNYMFYFGPPGTYLNIDYPVPASPEMDSRFSRLVYRYFPGGPEAKM